MKAFPLMTLMFISLITISTPVLARDEAGNIIGGIISILLGGNGGNSNDRNPPEYNALLLESTKIGSQVGSLLHGPDKTILTYLPANVLKNVDRGEAVEWKGSGYCTESPLCKSPYKVSGNITILKSGYSVDARLCFQYRSVIKVSTLKDVEDVTGIACYVHNYKFAGYAEASAEMIKTIEWQPY